jgi:hypothetical protein
MCFEHLVIDIFQVNAEARVGTLKIVRDLEDLDKQLRSLEEEGRAMEDKIRAGMYNVDLCRVCIIWCITWIYVALHDGT